MSNPYVHVMGPVGVGAKATAWWTNMDGLLTNPR